MKKKNRLINCAHIFNTELLQAEKKIDQKDKSRISISSAIHIASFKPHYMFINFLHECYCFEGKRQFVKIHPTEFSE